MEGALALRLGGGTPFRKTGVQEILEPFGKQRHMLFREKLLPDQGMNHHRQLAAARGVEAARDDSVGFVDFVVEDVPPVVIGDAGAREDFADTFAMAARAFLKELWIQCAELFPVAFGLAEQWRGRGRGCFNCFNGGGRGGGRGFVFSVFRRCAHARHAGIARVLRNGFVGLIGKRGKSAPFRDDIFVFVP